MNRLTGYKRLLALAALSCGADPVEDIATGNPLVFTTDLARPLKSLLIPFTPQQSGTGDPSPSNIRPLLPWEGLSVFGGGKNLFNGQYIKGVVTGNSTQGYVLNTSTNANSAVIQCKGNTKYTVKKHGQSNRFSIATSEVEPENNTPLQLIIENQNLTEYTFTTPAKALYIIVYVSTGTEQATPELQCEVGSSATAYEPYKPIADTDISFTSPVYGGTLDVVSGVLTVEWALFTAKWKNGTDAGDLGNNVRKKFITPVSFVNASSIPSAYCDTAKWRWDFESDNIHFYSNGNASYVFLPEETDGETEINIVGKLATPQEITLTPEQITAIVGDNTIWSDADGSMTAVYLKKG